MTVESGCRFSAAIMLRMFEKGLSAVVKATTGPSGLKTRQRAKGLK